MIHPPLQEYSQPVQQNTVAPNTLAEDFHSMAGEKQLVKKNVCIFHTILTVFENLTVK
jgi:hypothetical protein